MEERNEHNNPLGVIQVTMDPNFFFNGSGIFPRIWTRFFFLLSFI